MPSRTLSLTLSLSLTLTPHPHPHPHPTPTPNPNPDPNQERALCYYVLGKVHGMWTPLPRTLKDYISSPKPNGYRSLHTIVMVGTLALALPLPLPLPLPLTPNPTPSPNPRWARSPSRYRSAPSPCTASPSTAPPRTGRTRGPSRTAASPGCR